ncbi:uncharacterized protein LOC132261217 isoform X2 [Phlebotomus argentipes]|uniref:uncharacterized protein LOC132261217 isoform X2 n=1 Tax=Phlebotomus argentipes TaxID=94469 RepID=UPI002893292C|nr:uncharacterized protein LOC132261217 isoform X2 [Phlebotomus argentipes]
MEVCCLKMASRCRPARSALMDGVRLPPVGSSQHDCGSLSRVVMVRKRDQRLINHRGQGENQCEIVTFETIQTYKGHKPDRTIVLKETCDVGDLTDSMRNSLSSMKICGSTPQTPNAPNSLEPPAITNGHSGLSTPKSSRHNSPNPGSKSPTSRTMNLSLRHKTPSPTAKRRSGMAAVFTDFEVECLKAHNEFRARHSVPPLRLNKKLCRHAEEWAKIIAARGTPVHRNNSPYGENIFCAWSSGGGGVSVNGRDPVENWYAEVAHHGFHREPATLKTGHFTQVVWQDSRDLGVGQAKNRSGQVFVVANYDPPGNFIGSFAENVPPVGGFRRIREIESEKTSPTVHFEDTIDLREFADAVLHHHNELRRKHGAPELIVGPEVTLVAQEWAETLAQQDRFAHRPNSSYGENIYCLWTSESNARAKPRDVCRSWYEEGKGYTYGVEPKGILRAGHFTQLIWRSSRYLGVGMARTQKGKVIVVCNYHPRGNIGGQFIANVLRPKTT